MLVGLVNKSSQTKNTSKEFNLTNNNKQTLPSEIKFDHLEQLTKNNSQMNSPRSINYDNSSEGNLPVLQRKKTPSFMLDKDKRLNRFLTGVKMDNQLNYIIDMGDQVLYIGIIGMQFLLGKGLILRYSY
jgi:hypothetical protein